MSRQHVAQIKTKRWQRVRKEVFVRDRYRCCACGRAGRLECDHIVPLQRGGDPYAFGNLQTLCVRCHLEKTARENRRVLTPAENEWRVLVADLM